MSPKKNRATESKRNHNPNDCLNEQAKPTARPEKRLKRCGRKFYFIQEIVGADGEQTEGT